MISDLTLNNSLTLLSTIRGNVFPVKNKNTKTITSHRRPNEDRHYLSDSTRCLVAEGRIAELFCVVCLLVDLIVSVMPILWIFLNRGTNFRKAQQKQAQNTAKQRYIPLHCKPFDMPCEHVSEKSLFLPESSSSSSGEP